MIIARRHKLPFYRQVVKPIWHKAASLPHTDGSIAFARWRQCAFPSNAPQSASAPYLFCPLLSRFMYIDRRTCPGTVCSAPAPFRLQNFPFTCGDLTPHLIHGSLIPNGITIGSAAFAGLFFRVHSCDRPTDWQTNHATRSVAIGRV